MANTNNAQTVIKNILKENPDITEKDIVKVYRKNGGTLYYPAINKETGKPCMERRTYSSGV